MRLLVLGLPQCHMTNQSLVKWCICLPFLSCTGNLKLQSLLHVTLFLKRNHSPHFLHPVINLLAERSHLEPTIMLGSCTSDSLGFKGWFLVPPLHNMLQLDLKKWSILTGEGEQGYGDSSVGKISEAWGPEFDYQKLRQPSWGLLECTWNFSIG